MFLPFSCHFSWQGRGGRRGDEIKNKGGRRDMASEIEERVGEMAPEIGKGIGFRGGKERQ